MSDSGINSALLRDFCGGSHTRVIGSAGEGAFDDVGVEGVCVCVGGGGGVVVCGGGKGGGGCVCVCGGWWWWWVVGVVVGWATGSAAAWRAVARRRERGVGPKGRSVGRAAWVLNAAMGRWGLPGQRGTGQAGRAAAERQALTTK